MILIFEPNLPVVNLLRFRNDSYSVEKIELKLDMDNTFSKLLENSNSIKAIGYVLRNGGEIISQPVNILDNEILKRVKKTISIQPENNDLTYKIASYWFSKLPDIPHVLFCDTAFFVGLPPEASTYAIPYELRKKGIRRYGGNGLCHQWAMEQLGPVSRRSSQKVISVFLDNHTDIAAIDGGKAKETTIGFTPVEGVPSSSGCGDIDPTIMFRLMSAGLSLNKVNVLLSEESGFSGLLGRKCGLSDIFNDVNPDIKKIKDIYLYSLVGHIGSFISILGGVDSIVFSGKHIKEIIPIVSEVCAALDFMNVKCKINISAEKSRGILKMSSENSLVEIFCLEYDKWKFMADNIQTVITNYGGVKCKKNQDL